MNQSPRVNPLVVKAGWMERWACVLAVGFALGWSCRGAAAEPPPPPERPKVEGPVRYVGPDTYILLDEAGRGQPVLGMTYEDFMAAWKKSQQIGPQVGEPRFTIDDVTIAGAAKPGHAELDVKITIRLLSRGNLEIPLGLAKGILREQPVWEVVDGESADASSAGAGTSAAPLLDFAPARGGYVVGLHGKPDQRRRVTLRLLVPLVRDANETCLALNLPRALVSRLSLDVPAAIATAAVNDDSVLSREPTDDGGTRLAVAGPAGDFRLSWSTAEPRRPELATVLSAVGAISISIDGHSVRSDARLTVRSYGGSFDRFRVRLPPGAQLVQQDRRNGAAATSPRYRITTEDGTADGDRPMTPPDKQQRVVLVELPERQAGPVEVDLATEQPLVDPLLQVPAGRDMAVELAGFEVLGAVRQFGEVALDVDDDWQLRWDIGQNVRQVERSGLTTRQAAAGGNGQNGPVLRESLPTAAFQYDRAPWSLRVRVVERQFRVHATPSFVLDLGANEARLRVGLTYQVPGARAFEFRVQLNGWELTPEPIESDGLVDRDRVQVTRDGLLLLPLSQASPRRAEIAFNLRRALSPGLASGRIGRPVATGSFALPLPVPEADSVAAADLTVFAAAGADLRLDQSRSRGLSSTPVTDATPLAEPGFEGRPVLRYRALLPEAVFAAQRTNRERVVETAVTTDLAIDSSHIVARQLVEYSVRNQPLEQLTFNVPDDWTLVDDQVELLPPSAAATPSNSADKVPPAEQPLVLTAERAAAGDERNQPRIRIPLPQSRMGRFQVRLIFDVDRPDGPPLAGPLLLELAGPSNGRVTDHRVSITSSPSLAVAFDVDSAADIDGGELPAGESAWQPVVRDRHQLPASESALELVSDVAESALPLLIRPVDPARLQSTTVERIWLQTWQSGDKVQERAAFRFRTTGSSIVVELPPGAASQEVEVTVDGRLADVRARDEGRVAVDLSDSVRTAQGDTARTLELRYRRTAPTTWLARRTLTPPQLSGMSTLGDVYWQLILPAGLHVMRTPDPLVPVDRWQWFDVFWGREPTLGQGELEDWVGATRSEFAPSSQQTAYLFSGLAPVASIDVLTVPRWLIVLAASGTVLVVGCAWIYLPAVRRAWVGMLLAGVIAALAVIYPVPAALLGEASIVGWILALVAVGLRGWLARPARRQPLTAGSTQLKLRPASRSDSYASLPADPSTGKTPATPISVPDSD